MPTHKIHLAIAKKVNDKLNLDLNSIMLGSVLPDICNEKDHQLAHFQFGEKDLEGLANPDKFIKKYKNKLDNPIMVGYLIHILTDRFYNEYIFRNYYIYDENNNGIGINLKGKAKSLNNELRKNLKHRDLFIYDKWLLNHNYVFKFDNYNCINNVINIDEASFSPEKLKTYILSSNNDIDKLNIFSKLYFYNYKIASQKEFDKIFNECIKYIFEYIDKNAIDMILNDNFDKYKKEF